MSATEIFLKDVMELVTIGTPVLWIGFVGLAEIRRRAVGPRVGPTERSHA